MKKKPAFRSAFSNPRILIGLAFCLIGLLLALVSFGLYPSQSALAQSTQKEPRMISDQPPDTTHYVRPAVPEDYAPGGRPALPQLKTPSAVITVVRDVVVDHPDELPPPGGNRCTTDLCRTDTFNDGEPSIAIDPTDTSQIVISAFSGSWDSPNNNDPAPLWYSANGGATWTKQFTISVVPGNLTRGCPCDQAFDYDRSRRAAGTFLAGDKNVYSGTTANPMVGPWNWRGNPAQRTNLNSLVDPMTMMRNVDQPWLLVNRDPTIVNQDNIYVAYDDFVANPTRMRVAVSLGANPPDFTVDNPSGTAGGGFINPGHRLAVDPTNGVVYSLWQVRTGPGVNGGHRIEYHLNRSINGGANWTLNGMGAGDVVATADSTQGVCTTPGCFDDNTHICVSNTFKFGTVNALLGGVLHAAVDPTNGDVYYVYGNRDGAGNNRLFIKRLTSDGAGGLTIPANGVDVTGAVQAALPSVAVSTDRTVGVLYTQFERIDPASGMPMFSVHFAISTDLGLTFPINLPLENFLSSSADNGACTQRVFGDYQQVKTVGTTFYGVFTGNGFPFGRPFANHDPIFFKVVSPQTTPLDHFKAYPINPTPPPLNEPVALQDQFDPTLENRTVLTPFRFANPVDKSYNGVTSYRSNPDSHLKLYNLDVPLPTPTPRMVEVLNQFGPQTLTVQTSKLLAVPTGKNGSVFHDLDHFKCYECINSVPLQNVVVNLVDQFHPEMGVQVLQPTYFCNPVIKIHNGTTGILHPEDHLVFYGINQQPPFNININTNNQFGSESNLSLQQADLLGVPSKKRQTDHFKAYPISPMPPPLNVPVTLQDQFDPTPEPRVVLEPVRFANPVDKSYNGVTTFSLNPDSHLKLYNLNPVPSPTPKFVQVHNQFGLQTLTVNGSKLLAVPTQKNGVGQFQNLDHFKCYDCTGNPLMVFVDLTDQFHFEPQVQVLQPRYFCNPVKKIHNGTTEILHPEDHLVFYAINPQPPFNININTNNQFGSESNLSLQQADLLGVPSWKLSVSTLPTPTPTPTPATPTPTVTPAPTPTPSATCPPGLSEGFDDITTLPAAGWVQTNHSTTIGTTGWFQGNDTVFPSHQGAANSYIGANFNNTTGTNTISNWLLTPPVTLQNGLTMTFWTRTTTANPFPDRLQVRMSTSGASSNVGVTATDVGDFTSLLLDINPTYMVGGYPDVWTQQTVTITGVPAATLGRLAFRYFVENGGPTGSNSNYIGIDTFQFNGACGGTTPTPTPTATIPPTPTPGAQAVNLSTRMRVQTGDNVGIGGFIITGSTPKQVLLRAIGPSLAQLGVPNVLADPVLELHGTGGFVTIVNDNWRDDPVQEALIIATGIPPTNNLESAIVATLSPGGYTAIVSGKNNTSGIGLVEVYDLSQSAGKLANLSTRAFVSTGDNVVIAGFILSGQGVGGLGNIILRGIGPSLSPGIFPASAVLADPTLELRDAHGTLLRANNDWQDDAAQAAEISEAGLAPTNNLESAISAPALPPGLYTVLLTGRGFGTGIGVVELFAFGPKYVWCRPPDVNNDTCHELVAGLRCQVTSTVDGRCRTTATGCECVAPFP